MNTFYGRFSVGITVFILLCFCENRKELLTTEVYEGPTMEMDNVNMIMTDSFTLAVRLKAPKRLYFESGDEDYPDGLFLEYFEDDKLVCTFRSNAAYYINAEDLYRGEGNVVVRNVDTDDILNTEELFWNPTEEKFYTDKFVTIVAGGEIHTGEGLTANQDFSSYQIHKPAGTISVEDEQ